MAKFVLKANAEVDVLTADELDRAVKRLEKKLGDLQRTAPLIRREFPATLMTDGSGNLGGGLGGTGLAIYQVPAGYQAFVHRIAVNSSGATPSAPITSGEISMGRNGANPNFADYFLPISGVVAPVLITEGGAAALWLNSGDSFMVAGSGLPVTTSFYFSLQVRLWATSAVNTSGQVS